MDCCWHFLRLFVSFACTKDQRPKLLLVCVGALNTVSCRKRAKGKNGVSYILREEGGSEFALPSTLAVDETTNHIIMDLDLSKPLENDFNAETATEDEDEFTSSAPYSIEESKVESRPESLPEFDLEDLSIIELRDRARILINEAIEYVPIHKKKAYLEAVRVAPEIVEQESSPFQFLLFCDKDVWKAALRLCVFWHERLLVFGEDRAFRQMELSGKGAITKDDILSLQAGFPVALPKTKDGRFVLFLDRKQALAELSRCNVLRCLWFIGKLMMEDAHPDGCLILDLLTTKKLQGFDTELVANIWYTISHVFPIKYQQRSLCFLPEYVGCKQASFAERLIAKYTKIQLDLNVENTEIYLEVEDGQIYQALMDLGLNRDGLPADLGGSWHYLDATNLIREAVLQARDKNRRAKAKRRRKAAAEAKKRQISGEVEGVDDDVSVDSVPEIKKTRRRISNAIHSRRKRERQFYQYNKAEADVVECENENARLKAEQSKLKGLLAEATRLAATHESFLRSHQSTAHQNVGTMHQYQFEIPLHAQGIGYTAAAMPRAEQRNHLFMAVLPSQSHLPLCQGLNLMAGGHQAERPQANNTQSRHIMGKKPPPGTT